MDPYSMERWILERHEAVIRTAEVRSRAGMGKVPPRRLSVWLAGNLRDLADRLDTQPVKLGSVRLLQATPPSSVLEPAEQHVAGQGIHKSDRELPGEKSRHLRHAGS